MGDRFDRLGGTAPQCMDLDDIPPPHVSEQGAQRDLLWRYRNIDRPRSH